MMSSAGRVRVAAVTEQRNPATREIDTVTTVELLDMLHAEDARVIPAVAAVLPQLAELVDRSVAAVRAGGHVHYFGAGTSGRLAVLDAAELMPTYGVDDLVVAHHAGGIDALVRAAENVEDDSAAGAEAAAGVTTRDVVIGLTASGRTPFVAGALHAARQAGALTALVTAHPLPRLADTADIVLAADTGPEAITGSTRLKAGTAEKLILNAFSTALMVKLGRTYSNLMVQMRATNAKLRGRAIEMLMQATGFDALDCEQGLDAAGNELPLALTVLLMFGPSGGSDPGAVRRCRVALQAADGRVRDALAALAGGL